MRCPPAGIDAAGLLEQLQSRVEELETRIAFQEDALQTMSEQIADQREVINQQQAMLQTLYRQLRDVQDLAGAAGDSAPAQEIPPHY